MMAGRATVARAGAPPEIPLRREKGSCPLASLSGRRVGGHSPAESLSGAGAMDVDQIIETLRDCKIIKVGAQWLRCGRWLPARRARPCLRPDEAPAHGPWQPIGLWKLHATCAPRPHPWAQRLVDCLLARPVARSEPLPSPRPKCRVCEQRWRAVGCLACAAGLAALPRLS